MGKGKEGERANSWARGWARGATAKGINEGTRVGIVGKGMASARGARILGTQAGENRRGNDRPHVPLARCLSMPAHEAATQTSSHQTPAVQAVHGCNCNCSRRPSTVCWHAIAAADSRCCIVRFWLFANSAVLLPSALHRQPARRPALAPSPPGTHPRCWKELCLYRYVCIGQAPAKSPMAEHTSHRPPKVAQEGVKLSRRGKRQDDGRSRGHLAQR